MNRVRSHRLSPQVGHRGGSVPCLRVLPPHGVPHFPRSSVIAWCRRLPIPGFGCKSLSWGPPRQVLPANVPRPQTEEVRTVKFHYLESLSMATVFAVTRAGAALADPAPAIERDRDREEQQLQIQDSTQQWIRDREQDADRLQDQLRTNVGLLAQDRLRTRDQLHTCDGLCAPDRLRDMDRLQDRLHICI